MESGVSKLTSELDGMLAVVQDPICAMMWCSLHTDMAGLQGMFLMSQQPMAQVLQPLTQQPFSQPSQGGSMMVGAPLAPALASAHQPVRPPAGAYSRTIYSRMTQQRAAASHADAQFRQLAANPSSPIGSR